MIYIISPRISRFPHLGKLPEGHSPTHFNGTVCSGLGSRDTHCSSSLGQRQPSQESHPWEFVTERGPCPKLAAFGGRVRPNRVGSLEVELIYVAFIHQRGRGKRPVGESVRGPTQSALSHTSDS